MSAERRDFAILDDARRELQLVLDGDGIVRFADGPARRLIGAEPGVPLRALVAPGCEAKLDDFLVQARAGAVDCCELPFGVDREPTTISLCSRPRAGDVLVLGHAIPPAFASAMDQINEMVGELAESNRVISAQRRDLAARHAELLRANGELSEAHQGVLSLHRELQLRSETARQDGEVKTRLLSNLSHELRTPLHSILGLADLLLGGRDGALVSEQQKQVRFIQASAQDLLALVNDVLDLGRLESGHGQVHPEPFALEDFLAALRGALRPLVPAGSPVELVIEDGEPARLDTDRTKLGQIVRNLVSNAIKFTERGEIRVRTRLTDDRLIITVADSGIGIEAGDRERIFEEYGQVDSHLQRKVTGTGLGLPLARRTAERLGGSLSVASEPGVGSTFTVEVPRVHDEARAMHEIVERSRQKPAGAASILVVEDDRQTLFLYEKYLVMAGFHVLPARTIEEAMRHLADHRPAAIVLDVMLEGDASWSFLARIKQDPATQDIPVLVVTVTDRGDKARALGADEFWLKPVDQQRLLRKLKELARATPLARILVIDDDETARYIIKRHLDGTPYEVYEAATGAEGVRIARSQHPHVILLDFLLQGATAFDVIDELKADPRTRGIPVIVVTSQVLDELDRRRLLEEAQAVISKQHLSRELAINRIRDALQKAGHLAIARGDV
jgi:signal transduction histidine kinase/CheY-like chemotaxis protein